MKHVPSATEKFSTLLQIQSSQKYCLACSLNSSPCYFIFSSLQISALSLPPNSVTFMSPNLRCVLKSSLPLTSQPSEKHCHSPWNPLLILLPLGCTHSPFLLPAPPFLPKMLSSPELDPKSPLLLDSLLCSIVIGVSHCSLPPWAAQTLPMIKFHLPAMAPTFMPPVQTLF